MRPEGFPTPIPILLLSFYRVAARLRDSRASAARSNLENSYGRHGT